MYDVLVSAISELWQLNLTFVSADPARASHFGAWDPVSPGGLGGAAETTSDLDLMLPATRGTQRTTVATQKISIAAAIDSLASLGRDQEASRSAHAWAAVTRAALSFVAAGRVLPWVSPQGWDTWRVDPLDASDLDLLRAIVRAMPAEAHATVHGGRGTVADPMFAVRAACDAIADCFIRTPAAHRISDLTVFANPSPTRVPQLRPWVNDLATAHCATSRLVLRMHPPPDLLTGNAPTCESTTSDPDESLWTIRFQLQSHSDPSLIINADDYWRAPTEVLDRLGRQAETVLFTGLRSVTRLVEPLADLLGSATPATATIADSDLDALLDRLDDLAEVDVDVRWPSELVAPQLERRLVVASADGDTTSGLPSAMDLASLLDVNWEFLLDGIALTAAELAVVAEAKRSVVPLRGRWVRLDRPTLDRLRTPIPALTPTMALAIALGAPLELADEITGVEEAVAVRIAGSLAGLATRLQDLAGEREIGDIAGLHAELRDYQRRGVAWMADLCDLGFGGCLADDMGLGKTIQILALHARSMASSTHDDPSKQGPTLVVCPTSLMNNWEREAARFVPGAPVLRFHGAHRHLSDVTSDAIVITSYGVVRTDAERLNSVAWGLIVADEAQHVKNPRSRSARALREISSGSRMALTGTPVENKLVELWSILDWAVPGLLGPLETFRRTTALPIERDGDAGATRRLQQLVQPFLLRRTKQDPGIAPELPPKIERDLVVPLTPEQVTLYRATVDTSLAEVAAAQGINRRGLVLKLLTGLKQITNHPAQYLGESGPLADRSGKLEALDHLLDAASAAGESTLIFSQYVAMGRLLLDHHRGQGRCIELLHGGLSVAARQDLVDRFQAGTIDTLVLSLKAGGTGLNLTAATNVVHYDRWWNPAVEDQATDRAYRIGQDQTVTVHRLITEGTVEDRIAELLRNKRALADRVTGTGEGWIGELDDAALADLVELAVAS